MKVLLAAGGSGGHIFPAVAVREKLASSGVSDIFFIASRRKLDRNVLREYGTAAYFLSVNPMPLGRNVFAWLRFCCKFCLDLIRSLVIIARLDCDRIVGFGGYSSGAAVLAGKALRRKIILHEQNYVPGRANRLLFRFCDRMAVSFEPVHPSLPREAGKVRYTGSPVREHVLHCAREEAVEKLSLLEGVLTVLVMGGSQGASFMNEVVSRAIIAAKKSFPGPFQVIHLTGGEDHPSVERFYREHGFPARVIPFIERIEYAYAAADIAVSRSGASAVFELACYSLPMLLVPYPHSKNDQRYNARYFEEREAALVMEERTLSERGLKEALVTLLTDQALRERLGGNAARLAGPDAAAELAGLIMEA